MRPQQAIDHPSFSSDHFPSSFGGRAHPLSLRLDGRFPAETAERLAEMGHKVRYEATATMDGKGEGSVNCVGVRPNGIDEHLQVFGASCSTWSKNYAAVR
jgi:hypothetical protein